MLRTLIVPLLLVPTLLLAQTEPAERDTVRLRAVQVTADAEQDHALGVGITRVTEQRLRELRPLQISDALQQVPGLFLREYGGVGGLKSVSLRGGSAAQTVILLDGLSWNAAQSGQADLQTIPAAFVQQITVERGGLGAIHGANAMTGALIMDLQVPQRGVTALVDGGSFDTWRTSLSAGATTGLWRIGGGVDAYGSAGSYPYAVDHDGETVDVNRTNADVRSLSGIVRAEFHGAMRSSVTAMARSAERGVPGAVVQNAVTQQQARLVDRDAMVHVRSNILPIYRHSVWLDAGLRLLDQHYTDPQASFAGPSGIDAEFSLRDAVVALHGVHLERASDWVTRYRIELGYVDLRGTSLQPGLGDLVVRRHAGANVDTELGLSDQLVVQGALRADAYSDAGAALNGFLGARLRASEETVVSASVGTGFRPASFNELYFLNYGTSDLRPERSVTISVEAEWQPLSWVSWNLSTYVNRFTDLIVSVPLSPVVTSARNVGAAWGAGVESTVTAHLPSNVETVWTYTLQELRDATGRAGVDGTRIPYVPVELIGVQTTWRPGVFRLSMDYQYTSYRYAQAGAEFTSILTPYHLLGAAAAVAITGSVMTGDVMLRIDNLLDERYQVVRGYPMPGRQVRLSVRVSS